MGKKKNSGGADAGGKNKIRSQEVSLESDSMEESLQKRSRFSTEHLKQLEALYREGLNLEEEILAEEDLSAEELQGALDELETLEALQGNSETSQGEFETVQDSSEILPGESETVQGSVKDRSDADIAEKARRDNKTAEESAPDFGVEIPLEKLTSAEVTLQQLAEAGITPQSAVSGKGAFEEAASEKANTEKTTLEKAVSFDPDPEEAARKDAALKETAIYESTSNETDGGSVGEEETGNPDQEEAETDDPDPVDAETANLNSEETESQTPENAETASFDEDPEELQEAELAELLEVHETERAVPEDGEDPEKSENSADGSGESAAGPEKQRKSGLSKKTCMIQAAVFFIALFGISIVGLCMPLRPTESQIEKRTLTEFPEFTWESFLSGDYTDQISTWYADTFPFRETLLSWYTDFKKLFGIQGDEVYIGDVIVADDIPDIPEEDETTAAATDTDASATDAETTTPEETTAETTTEAPTETTTEAPATTAEAPTTTESETTASGSTGSDVVGEQIGSVYIYGDQAFSVYGFSLEMSDNYAKMISLAAEELAGKATVYNILVPLSYGIQLDSSVWESMGWSDEEKAIKYMYSQMSDDVKTVSVYQALLEHKNEYIYFRTDHHWTALGAYYAYQCFASVKGITANALDSFETMTFENYLGSLYSQSNESEALANNPDTIIAYVPRGTNKMTITQKDGSILDWRVIYDVTTWRNDSKYSCFIGGDNPFSVIENPEITDGSSVLLVKESFGNAFAPFLVDHYQYVYVIDFRYYSGHLEDVVDTYGIQDVIFMNNLNSAGGSLQNYLQSFIEPEEETSSGE